MDESTTVSSRESLAGGLIGLLKPAVKELDERVLAVRYFHITCCLIRVGIRRANKKGQGCRMGALIC